MLFLANIFGYIVAHWRVFAAVGAFLVLLIVGGLIFRACKPKAKINEEQIQKINNENETRRKEELREIIKQNADVIKTTENRTLATEENVKARDAEIEKKVAAADAKIVEAKSQGKDVTQAELICLLQPETCQ